MGFCGLLWISHAVPKGGAYEETWSSSCRTFVIFNTSVGAYIRMRARVYACVCVRSSWMEWVILVVSGSLVVVLSG